VSGTDSLALLREADPERYLACLFLPEDLRLAAAAVYLFDTEIAAIPWRVSDAAAGEIRIQWWRDVLGGSREDGGHPAASRLVAAIETYGLPRQTFDAYLQARVFDLYQDPMPDRSSLEAYGGETASVLLQMIATAAGVESGRTLPDASGHAGVVLAIVSILNNLSFHRARGQCYFPEELLAATGLSVRQFLQEPADARHANAISAMASLAGEHYSKARLAVGGLDRRIQSVFLPLATAHARLKRIGRTGQAIVDRGVGIGPLSRQFILWRAAWSGLPARLEQ
jgi:15-cis-phytoene synthase